MNAGLEHTGLPVADFTEEQFDQLFAVNTKGAFFTLKMAARTVADNGRILYISSSTAGYWVRLELQPDGPDAHTRRRRQRRGTVRH